jgi:hypothetical protein
VVAELEVVIIQLVALVVVVEEEQEVIDPLFLVEQKYF